MDDSKSLNILELYTKANENKKDIILKTEDGREYSRAEIVVFASMAMMIRSKEDNEFGLDYDRAIKTIILNSLDGKIDNLCKKDEYNRLIRASKELETEEGYGAKTAYERMISDFKAYLKPIYDEEKFINDNIKLHDTTRKGHILWGVNGDRLENVLEHIYGCLVLSLGMESEYDHNVDFNKIRQMLIIHETGEIIIDDISELENRDNKSIIEREAVIKLLSPLTGGNDLIKLWEEFDSHRTLSSLYAYLIDKIEYDMQVKMYEQDNRYDFNHLPENVATTNPTVLDIRKNGAQSVFDIHYEYDKNKYNSFPCFRRLLEVTKKY